MCIQILKENQVVKNNTCIHTYIHKENQVIKHRTILVCY